MNLQKETRRAILRWRKNTLLQTQKNGLQSRARIGSPEGAILLKTILAKEIEGKRGPTFTHNIHGSTSETATSQTLTLLRVRKRARFAFCDKHTYTRYIEHYKKKNPEGIND